MILKTSGWIPLLAALCNVALNLLVMRLALTNLSPSLIYPTLGAGGLCIVTLISVFLFRERLTLRQWIGIGLGACAVILLSL